MLVPYGVTATYHKPWDFGFSPGAHDRACWNRHPRSRKQHYVILVPYITDQFGTTAERDAFFNALTEAAERISLAGIWVAVYEGPA